MKIRAYALLVIGGGICLVLAAVTVVLLIRYSSQYRRVSEELYARTSELTALQQRQPFPNEENVQRASTSIDELQRGFNRLLAELSEEQQDPPSIERSQWPLLRQRVFGGLTERARASTVGLPDGFAYGFERYARALPDQRHLPRIARQLAYVEWACTVLLDSKVHAIRRIDRHLFEDEVVEEDRWGDGALPVGPATARGRRPVRTERREGAAFAPGYHEHPESLYDRERMVFAFTVRESALWEILDTLARAETFCVVTRVQVRNPTPRPGSAAARRPGVRTSPGRRPVVTPRWEEDLEGEEMGRPGVDRTDQPLTRAERIAAGRDELLEVELEIDFYRFRPKDQREEARL